MGPIRAVDSVLSHFFSVRGRASPSEYWWWYAAVLVGGIAAITVDIAIINLNRPSANPFTYLTVLFFLFTIIPSFTVTIRRLHDTGRSGWWYLIVFVPFGGIVLFVFTVLPSEHRNNIYGPPPGGGFRLRSGDDLLSEPFAAPARPQKNNPYAVYAKMEREDEMRGSPALAEARKAQVSEYYRQRVLGQN